MLITDGNPNPSRLSTVDGKGGPGNSKKSLKKALLKKILKAKIHKKTPKGASPTKLDGGLGKTPLDSSHIGGGSGSNLGTNGVF